MTASAELGVPRDHAIVLVHGAWVGEWSWLPIIDRLIPTGRAVHAVSLTGHGTRRHQGGPHVTLADHVEDVVATVETFDLRSVTLVGHSYGGRVITAAYERLADRLTAMVYLDAHTPVVTEDPPQSPERLAAVAANGGMLPFSEYHPTVDVLGSQDAVDWFMARTAPQSFACFSAPWLTELPAELSKTFVYALDNEPSRFRTYAEICRERADWAYRELDATHWLIISHADAVAEIIEAADPSVDGHEVIHI